MNLPNELQAALNEHLVNISHEQLITAAQRISLLYRTHEVSRGKHYIQNRNEALSYAVARMPATFGAVYHALKYTLDAMNGQQTKISSILDVGAGTGAATWAANELVDLDSIVCIEYADVMRKLGEALMLQGPAPLNKAIWKSMNIAKDTIDDKADLVIASYVINELDESQRLLMAEKLWSITNNVLLFIEAGTPEGYRILNKVRTSLLKRDAHILAPCPHEGPCPISGQDWCHFTCRIQRNRLHRLAKGGQLPYEDEKYTYLALTREETNPYSARILRHPQIGKGHVKLSLCTKDGLKQATYSKRDGDIYKHARKSNCGDTIPFE